MCLLFLPKNSRNFLANPIQIKYKYGPKRSEGRHFCVNKNTGTLSFKFAYIHISW